MGTPDFARVSLRSLIEGGYEVIGVVTQPDRPKGRGLELQPSEVKTLALQHHLPVWQPEKVAAPDFLELFKELAPDLVVVVAFGQKIPPEILFGPRYGCINVHGSLLPKYRGAAPIQWSILNGDTSTGVTTMYMDEGWDTGDLIYQEALAIDPDENFAGLYQRLADLGGELLVKTVRDIQKGVAPRTKQNHSLASSAPKLRPEQQRIDWAQPALAIHNLVRALAPVPGAETYLNGERLKVIETKMVDPFISMGETGVPGGVLQIRKKEGILVAAGDRPLLITKIQPAGKKIMTALEYANGRSVKGGISFN